MTKSVLGLFDDEDELRDHLAQNLTIIESGLRLIRTNFVVDNPLGVGGAFDILGRDQFGNFVIIEVKRSDQAARQALHELSKYIALFMEDQKVDSHKIRCFVVSTHWHELDVPLSLFKDSCPVEVKGFEVTAVGKTVITKERPLPKVSLESRLSPDMRFSFFDSAERQQDFCDDLQKALRGVPHVRAALIVMEPIADRERMCLLCAWRVPDIALADVKALIFNPDFQEEHYLFLGWELETDLCDWLEDQSDKASFVFASDSRATPEKVENYKSHHRYTQLVKLGDWPRNDLVNDLDEVMRCLVAKDVSAKSSRANQHHFAKTSSKSTGKAWDYASGAFEEFIGHNEFWLSMYKQLE
ncbi:endonuclease NucS domain-containing protein [Pseudomonas sp. 6D_7.1_Bac1]|uniref:endonuclease NucS domain-containing protein n=1 Tax=Pseudomonas sp. 6D_7.1_Bac1 TaxID=2971615 RepID=UPI0021C60329|nr:endonuclease NucS domain-containing protein [Pseudomonas sp. 6D_7.1_Bac1]MCU1752788.1 endonuclease NucS [Pseudomonas sp. 6D_7.1_Bac1]